MASTGAARERDALNALCDRQADILSRVAVALRGPEPPQTKWSHADLPERVTAVMRERDDLRARVDAMSLQGAHYINIVVRRNGEDHIYEGDWLRALLAEKEAK